MTQKPFEICNSDDDVWANGQGAGKRFCLGVPVGAGVGAFRPDVRQSAGWSRDGSLRQAVHAGRDRDGFCQFCQVLPHDFLSSSEGHGNRILGCQTCQDPRGHEVQPPNFEDGEK